MLPTKEMRLDHSMSCMIFRSSHFCVKIARVLLVGEIYSDNFFLVGAVVETAVYC